MGSYSLGLFPLVESHFLASVGQERFATEVMKGCDPSILTFPVELEPSYVDIRRLGRFEDPGFVVSRDSISTDDLRWSRLWISPDEGFNWRDAESFLKRLRGVRRRVGLEIIGNQLSIQILIRCHVEDLPVVEGNLRSQYPQSRLSPASNPWVTPFDSGNRPFFCDLVPNPPCSHLVTRPEELEKSPFESLLFHLSQLPATVVGFYQVLFQPVEWNHNWHANIDFLRDFENRLKTESDPLSDQKYRIPPSADQRQEAFEVEKKAHNDKPIFACAVRLGLLAHDSKSKFFLPLLDSSLNVFQHGGSPFNRLIDVDYFKVLPFGQVRMMFENGLVFRPGFLVNTEELVGFAHVPPPVLFKRDDLRWSPLERLIPSQELFEGGSPLGRMLVAEDVKTVHARLQEKFESIHIMGSPGVGKSTLMSSMILDDVKKGHGVAIIDPHGTVVTQVLQRLPDDCEDRVVFLSWADMDWVPLWNPLLVSDSRRSGRVVEELIAAFQSIMGASWGNRLEHLLRMSIRALCEIGSTSFLDLYSLLDSGPKNVNLIRRRIQQECRTAELKDFWNVGIKGYSRQEFSPCIHVLSKFVMSGEAPARTFSIPEGRIDLARLLQDNRILITDLSGLGPTTTRLVGSFLFSLLHISALSRFGPNRDDFNPFFVYVDEAHKFATHDLEHCLVEDRKTNVGWVLAHQTARQFSAEQIEVLGGTGASIIFSCNPDSAQRASKELLEKVPAEDILNLPKYEAFVRVGHSDVARVQTLNLISERNPEKFERILRQSHERYYIHESKFKRCSPHRDASPVEPDSTIDQINTAPKEAFEYDVFQ